MTQSSARTRIYPLRTLPKDIGVVLVLLVALGLAWLIQSQIAGRTRSFQEPDAPFRLEYPATWIEVSSLQDALLKVEDPLAASSFKTSLTVERKDLDPAAPPTLQTLVDRRVVERGEQTGYHFLADSDATVDGLTGKQLEYAYVVQPIDTPRRASLPVVVHAREYIIVAQDRTYYLTLAAPENEFEAASRQFDRIMQNLVIQ